MIIDFDQLITTGVGIEQGLSIASPWIEALN